MPRVVHFEISVDDPERAVKFYSEVFGWEIKKWEGPMDYWLVSTGPEDQPGIDGALMRREDRRDSVVNTIDVPSVDEFLTRITDAGGKITQPKQAVPGVGYVATCQDPEGNTFGLIEEDTSAK